MPHRSKQSEAAAAGTEQLVRAILEEIDRSFATAGPSGPTFQLAEFFRALDEQTLRAIAYRHGVFEQDLEADREERPSERKA